MKKIKINKQKMVLIITILLLGLIPIITIYNLKKPTTLNKIIANKLYKEPANKNFKDDNLYNCVVDTYNNKNNTSLPYTTNLTDEQLLTITRLYCNGIGKKDNEKITDTQGIEKLTDLTELNLPYNNLSSIDVSKNINLTTLDLRGNNLSSIDVSKNPNLVYLYLTEGESFILNIGVTSGGTSTKIKELDISNNPKLKKLYIEASDLTQLDIRNNLELESLEIGYNNLQELDISKNTNLTYLGLGSNNLSTIDLNNNQKLEYLNLYNNSVTDIIGLNKLTNLLKLDVSGSNKLTNIDVSNNPNLTYLSLSDNNLRSIDLNKNVNLTKLDLKENYYLNEIVLPDNNKFDFSILSAQGTKTKYIKYGTTKVFEPIEEYNMYLNNKISLVNEEEINIFKTNLGLKNLTAKIYDDEKEITTGNIKEGYILKIYDGEKELGKMPIEIFKETSGFKDKNLYNCVIDTYNSKNKTSLPYTTNLTDEQLLTITSLSCNGIVKKDNEKITDTQGIEKLTNLTELSLSGNSLSSIDLSKNINLTELSLSYNNLSSIDLSKNINLTSLYLSRNKLSSIDLSKNINLKSLTLYNNNLSSIDLNNNTNLTNLFLGGIMNTVDLSNNTKLVTVLITSTNLNTIDLSNNKEITYLNLAGSNLSTIDLSKNINLTELNLSSNKLSSIDLNKNVNLTTLYLYDNNFNLGDTYLKKDESVTETQNIKLPSKYAISYEIENTEIAKYENGNITGLKSGNSKITATLNGIKESSSSTANDMKVSGNIYVYDYTSSTYDLTKDYIYTGINDFDKNKITCTNCTIEVNNNKLIIKVNNTIVKEYTLSKITSTTYDLTKDYIYTGINDFDKSKITCTNCTTEVSNNNLLIKINNQILDQYTLVKVSSNNYVFNNDNIYLNENETLDKSKITCTNCTTEVSDNKLIIKVNNTIVKEYTIKYNDPTPIYKKGDINHDGKINLIDVGKIFSHVRGKSIIKDETLLKECDLNNDGKVSLLDVGKLFSFVRGKTKTL